MPDNTYHPHEKPLESWKEIAAHLKRDVRTVIRWEKLEGLPVHRQMHQARSSVYAYPSELDAWKAGRKPERVVIFEPSAFRVAARALTLGACMLLVLMSVASGPLRTPRATASAARIALADVPTVVDEKTGAIIRELKFDAGEARHALSPDGTKVVYTNRQRNLVVRDLLSGTDKQITNVKEGTGAWQPFWSPDSKKVVYQHFQSFSEQEMRIVTLETGEDLSTKLSGFPLDWSKDGRFILYLEGVFGKSRVSLMLLPLDGGSPKKLFDPNPMHEKTVFRFSPDNRHIAFTKKTKEEFDLYLMPLEGGESVQITGGPSNDTDPLWTPDGKTLLFLSDRAMGRKDLWGIAIADGKPFGEPFLVKADMGDAYPFSFSDNGRLLFARWNSESHIYVTPIDPQTSQPAGEAIRLTQSPNGGFQPAWSPDGRRIAYYSVGVGGKRLRVMSADGKDDQEVVSVIPYIGPFAWAPDNEHIYIVERRPDTGTGIYKISILSKERKPVLVDQEILGHPSLSPDGARLLFIRGLQHPQIYMANSEGRNVRQLTHFEKDEKGYYPTWSPDGKQLAFSYSGSKNRLALLDVDRGKIGDVLVGTDSDRFWNPSWSPDGTRIAWTSPVGEKDPATGTERTEIRMVALHGAREHQQFRVNLKTSVKPSLGRPHWSPDGTKMLFTAATNVYQLLLMENSLKPTTAAH